MRPAARRYVSPEEDSARWASFPFRPGDMVISTRSKHGTTWMQMICALLVFQTAELPAPLGELSPWLDRLTEPLDNLLARLEAQRHRRFVKTHTPLDGLPAELGVTYIVVGRHPLDAAVSLYHQGANIDRAVLRRLVGLPEPAVPASSPRPALHEWLVQWIEGDPAPEQSLDSLPGVISHLAGAWARRDDPAVLLVHYDELQADLGGTMRRIAGRLGIGVRDDAWPQLVEAASFEWMRGRAETLSPDAGILKDAYAFFRRGTSGAGREALREAELAHYYDRTSALAPAGLLRWLHR